MAVSTTDSMVETQLCKLRGSSDTIVVHASSIFHLQRGIRIGLSAPVADRPYFEFSSSSERTTKRVLWVQVLQDLLGHVM